ncbi:PREDICTED: uncharacterized protein LOC109227660 [Nicotiana attenuata]|uniref:uncharacterized protein LOC109227660 n=1 Tax=Nicotiana attenuata TaxID=49451 RepID=UPI000904FA70|nr:PREDICTED: uncharacterized protein LOC109227660 [Nicotiana attenuata]
MGNVEFQRHRQCPTPLVAPFTECSGGQRPALDAGDRNFSNFVRDKEVEGSKGHKLSSGTRQFPVNMAEEQHMIFQEVAMPSIANATSSIVKPGITSHFKLKQIMIQLLHANGVTQDYVKLTLFPFSLLGKEKRWLKVEPANSITSWNGRKFLARFFPSGKTAKIRSEIVAFKQKPGESLYSAWERFKGLLRYCPHHNQTNEVLAHFFVEGLHTETKIVVDAAAGGVLELDAVSALSAQVAILANQVNWMTLFINKQQARPVQQVQIFCEVCGEGHMSNLYPANPESVYFVGNANRGQANQYGDTYNPNWRNHTNFSWSGNQGAQNQYRPQAPQQQYRPPQAEQPTNATSHLEEMMKKLVVNHSQNTRPAGALPSNTEPNPNAQVNVVTLRNGIVLEEVPKKKKYTASHEGELVPKPVEENEKENKGSEPEVPNYARYLRDIVENKRRHTEFETIALTEECSARFLSKLAPKLKGPGSLTIPLSLGK